MKRLPLTFDLGTLGIKSVEDDVATVDDEVRPEFLSGMQSAGERLLGKLSRSQMNIGQVGNSKRLKI